MSWVLSPLKSLGKSKNLKVEVTSEIIKSLLPFFSLREEKRPRQYESLVQIHAEVGLDSHTQASGVCALCMAPGDVWRNIPSMLNSLLPCTHLLADYSSKGKYGTWHVRLSGRARHRWVGGELKATGDSEPSGLCSHTLPLPLTK